MQSEPTRNTQAASATGVFLNSSVPEPGSMGTQNPGITANPRLVTENVKQERKLQCGFYLSILSIILSIIFIGLAVFCGILSKGPGWPYAGVLTAWYVGDLVGSILVLAMKENKKVTALLFWISWTALRFLVEIVVLAVFIAVNVSKGHLAWGSKYSKKQPRKPNDAVQDSFLVMILSVTFSVIIYVIILTYMCRYYHALKYPVPAPVTSDENIFRTADGRPC